MRHRRLIWFFLWLLSLVGISFYGGAASYGLFFALTLLPLISFLYLVIAYFQFKIYQNPDSMEVICGQPTPYTLVLRNEGFLGISCVQLKLFSDFSRVDSISENTEYALLPGDEIRYETNLICKYRGEYDVGIKQIIFTDFFKLFRFRCGLSKRLHMTVYPRLAEPTSLTEAAYLSTITRHQTGSIHKEPDVVVRDYIRGDSLRHMHWKSTARTGSLQVRNDIPETKQEVTLLFDTERFGKSMSEYLPLESRILEVSLSLAKYFAKQNARLTLYYRDNGLQKQTVENARSFEAAYARISRVCFKPTEHFFNHFEDCSRMGVFLDTRLVIAVFHEPNTAIFQLARQLSQNNITVLLYVVTDTDIHSYTTENTYGCSIRRLPVEAEWEGLV